MTFLLRLFPEITLKSPAVRRAQTRQLGQNIRRVLKALEIPVEVTTAFDRILVKVAPDDAQRTCEALQQIPGIDHIQAVEPRTFADLDDLSAQVCALFAPHLQGKAFAVRARRQGEHGFSSQDVERRVGSALLMAAPGASIDLRQPDVTVRLAIRDQSVDLETARWPGLGGYPLGSQEAVVSLLSGGFDSAVAAYLAIRRGLRSHFVFFNLGGVTHEAGVRQMALHLWQRYQTSHRMRFVSVPFDGVLAALAEQVPDALRGVILKRLMMRAADAVAESLNACALVTGEAVAQVASQTLPNLGLIDRACERLVLRPLIAYDKTEIIRLARQIGTEALARHMPEYCGVIARQPATAASATRVLAVEAKLPEGLIDDALARRQVLFVDALGEGLIQAPGELERVSMPPPGVTVVDIRHPDVQQARPLVLPNNPVRAIPFYALNRHVDELAALPGCLLYCEQGTMSQLHGLHLRDRIPGIRVYQPDQ
ncbi:MAG: tRNA 4-thiouridine(8) synthase ThiI [Gammaproteobacteria bacterium]|nr:tRNA 4-thiouridine(8) synthase ThiI [Gammaproteobacteria bacterium]